MAPRDGRLEREHGLGASIGLRDTGERQQLADVRGVIRAERGETRVGAEILFAIGKAQAALEEEGNVRLLSVNARLDGQAEETSGLEDAPVQWIDVGARPAAEQARETLLVRDGVDAVELRLDRGAASRLDRRVVQPCST